MSRLLLVLLAAATTFDAEYTAGQDSYNLGKYDEAAQHFTKAHALDASKPGPVRWLGRTERAMKKWDDCLRDATLALKMAPTSPQAPEVKKDIEACRAGLGRPPFAGKLAEGQGALFVSSDLDGALVRVDGIRKGATPLDPLPLNVGDHTLHVEKQGYAAYEATISVLGGIVVDANVTFLPVSH